MNINHKPAEMDFRDQIKDRSADICNPPTFPVLSDATDGNQPPSGLRGDPGVLRTSGDDTRAQALDVSAAETLLKECIATLKTAPIMLDPKYPSVLGMSREHVSRTIEVLRRDLLALLSASPSAGEGSKT